MLQKLFIQNYAIIETLSLSFQPHLTTVTGETGAGKSILLGALGLILGDRADLNVLFDKDKKCVVEGTFAIDKLGLEEFFKLNDLDQDGTCQIRREISVAGKSRAFINDTPVTLTVLRELTEQLVDLHRQHQTHDLSTDALPLLLVDALADNGNLLQEYKSVWSSYKTVQQSLKKLQTQQESAIKEKDFLEFQLHELQKMNLQTDEQALLESESAVLEHAESIKKNLQAALQALQNEEWSGIQQLKNAVHSLQSLQNFNPKLKELFERLNTSYLEIEDIASEIEITDNKTLIDEERMQLVNERLDQLYRLQKKHGLDSVESLLNLQSDIESQLSLLFTTDDTIAELSIELASKQANLEQLALQLSKRRNACSKPFEEQVAALLSQVGMPNAQLNISILSSHELHATGKDDLQFLFAANKGSEFQDLGKVASGGELSRLMLCLKTIVANKAQLPTLIFDEIDTGISGEVARKVGALLQQLASTHQIICITHLPQIAARGESHYFVYKHTNTERTSTHVKLLTTEERIEEIAKMLSGEPPGTAALANAKELLMEV